MDIRRETEITKQENYIRQFKKETCIMKECKKNDSVWG